MSIEKIAQYVNAVIAQYTGKQIRDYSCNLFDIKYNIAPVDFLNVFTAIEKTFSIDAFSFLEQNSFDFFTINGLSDFVHKELIKSHD